MSIHSRTNSFEIWIINAIVFLIWYRVYTYHSIFWWFDSIHYSPSSIDLYFSIRSISIDSMPWLSSLDYWTLHLYLLVLLNQKKESQVLYFLCLIQLDRFHFIYQWRNVYSIHFENCHMKSHSILLSISI